MFYCSFPTKKAHCPYRNIFPTKHRFFFTFPQAGTSSGPWSEIFYIPPCLKSLPIPMERDLLCTFLHAGKVFRSLAGDLLHSPMLKKYSDPWCETFYIPSCQKIFQTMERYLLHSLLPRKVFRSLEQTFYNSFPHAREVFQSLERDLLHSPMPEKSSCPWKETYYIPPCQKSLLVPGRRPFTFPHARKVFRSLEQDLSHSTMPEKSSSLWSEIFYIPPCRKSLPLPGARSFTFPLD
jgi:hypothetical protein